jgi:replicative DNA helicase
MNARTNPPELQTFERESIPLLRIPPSSTESEMALLGGLLMDASLWDVVADLVAEADFYRHEHRIVFTAISALALANKTADVVTVFTRLQSQGHAEEIGGLAYLNALAQFQPSARSMRGYAEIIRERAMSRALIAAADEIAAQAFSDVGTPAAERIEQATAQLTKLLQGAPRDDWQDADAGMVDLLDRLQNWDASAPDYIPTGLAEIDERLEGGMRPGELIVIGARPSMGKSAMGLTIAANVAAQGRAVGFFSMEMPKAQVYSRLMSMTAHIHLSRIKRPDRLKDHDWPNITEAVDKIRMRKISVSDQTGLTINQVRAKVRALRRRRGEPLGLVVVDYLGLMSGADPKMPRAYQLEDVTKGLKSLAKELGMPIMLLVQLNRKVEERVDQMPIMSDIRDAGSVEQDADIIIFIHRPYKANPGMGDEWKDLAKVSIAKVRDGEPGIVDLMYVGENTRFKNWPTDISKPSSLVKTKGKGL